MKLNVGSTDRIIRISIAMVIFALGLYFQSWWGVIGLVPLITAFIRWCPAYTLFGISSCNSTSCRAAR